MKRKALFFLSLVIFINLISAQNPAPYSRVKIYIDDTGMKKLAEAGITVDHGEYRNGAYFISDFSNEEIALIQAKGFRYEVQIADVQEYYEKQNNVSDQSAQATQQANPQACFPVSSFPTPANFKLGSMGGYFTYDEIMAHLDTMVKKFPNLITSRKAIGTKTTYDGWPLYWLRISDNPNTDEAEPEIFYNAATHAREACSVSQLIMYMYYLLENYSTNPEVKFLVDNTEMYFVPLVNPDGYIYNETNNPNGGGMWRKNRRNNWGNSFGVDLNRNFGYNWGYDDIGSSPNPNSDTYRGPSSFSEPETQIIRDFCVSRKFKITLNFHTYGNTLIYPWGYVDNLYTSDSATFVNYSKFITKENRFTCGTSNQTVNYNTNGGANDWMYGDQASKSKIFSMTPEVGIPSDGGFWPPQSKIINICKSTIRLNLNAALLLTNYVEAKDAEPMYVPIKSGYLNYSLKRLGLDNAVATYSVSVKGVGPEIISVGSPKSYSSFSLLQELNDSISFDLNPSVISGQFITYVLTISNGAYSRSDTIRKRYGPSVTEFSSDCDAMTLWTSSSWGLNTVTFVSSPGSLTDSPFGDYLAQDTSFIIAKNPINLTDAISARVRFWAKWETQVNYDFAQLQASEDGGNTWLPICGKYSKPGNGAEDEGNPVYDGFMFDWVREEASLDDFIGKTIQLRFRFQSDRNSQYDGFNFDDFVVDKMLLPSGNAVKENRMEDFTIGPCYPNPSGDNVSIPYRIREHNTQAVFVVFDAYGRKVMEENVEMSASSLTLDVRALSPGVYFYGIESGNIKSTRHRMVIIH